jgi:FG-GAP-like repeat
VPLVRVYDGAALLNGSANELFAFLAYNAQFTGGVTIAVGDVTGDGRADIVTGAGAGGGPHVRVFDGSTRAEVASYFAYDPAFRGGVTVAAGDVNRDGRADVITGAGPGGGPHVKVFDAGSGTVIRQFLAYDPAFRGGVAVAAGSLTDDASADIITGAGPGGGPHVRVFDGATGRPVGDFLAYDAGFRGGVQVASMDMTGDGRAEIVTGPGAGGGPHVKVFDGATGQIRFDRFAYDPAFRGGVAVGGFTPVRGQAAVTVTSDFRQGAQGWSSGFADWPGTDPAFYALDSGIRTLPAEIGPGTGFMIQGSNHSDDLFMFVKRQLTTADGILPNQSYRVQFTIRFGSNAPMGAVGVGGSPGEGVTLKAGAGATAPLVVPVGGQLRMNVDKGDQIIGGRYASVFGNVANGRTPDPADAEPYVSVTRTGTHAFAARSDAAGNLWLLVGTDSGFEGLTRLYYQSITVSLRRMEGLA